MEELFRFAEDGNADQCYAIIRDKFNDDVMYSTFADLYESGRIDDYKFCQSIKVQN